MLLLALYLVDSYFVSMFASMRGDVSIFGMSIPSVSLTGVLSSLSNLLLIFMVVFFKKMGYITALVMLLIQLPLMIRGLIFSHNTASLPGIVSSLMTILAITIIYRRSKKITAYQEAEVSNLKKQQQYSQRLFEQTATALVSAIDAKDTYSHGHSQRVAEYSEMIAKQVGKDEEECRRIFYAALLHDVGKLGVSDVIINKKGKLNHEEFEAIKQHPVLGYQILSSIREYPYLSIGAHFHHERYDGKGYPSGLKGEDIPEIARIISVADAYDAMSSTRSYRDALPQQIVREEIIKGIGTQFDPKFAHIMRYLIDMDPEYRMREQSAVVELDGRNHLNCKEFGSEVSDGIVITQKITRIQLKSVNEETKNGVYSGPAIILFDSLDESVHTDEKSIEILNYFEYCRIWLDGRVECTGARKIESVVTPGEGTGQDGSSSDKVFGIEAVKCRDHVQIKIDDGSDIREFTIALPDCSRYAYIGLTGENCNIYDVTIEKDENEVPEDYIPRIAELVSYIEGPEGDVPNVQVDGYRTDASVGIPIRDGMKLRYHTKSLPTARLVWHCAFLSVFSSKDGTVNGEDFREYGLIRTDGESWESEGISTNKLTVNKQDDFEGWDAWKEGNKKGYDCVVLFERSEGKVIITTDNLGILIRNTTTILDGNEDLYVALTGDQCAITNIRIE